MDDVHVYPLNDLREHDTDSRYCWCRPKRESYDSHTLLIHNSADGREIRERAEDHAFGAGLN